jgi:hypothetical protein
VLLEDSFWHVNGTYTEAEYANNGRKEARYRQNKKAALLRKNLKRAAFAYPIN